MRVGFIRTSVLAVGAAMWIFQPVAVSSQAQRGIERARAFSARHLDDLAAKHGRPGETGHREMRLQIEPARGQSHRRVQQLYRGVPVFGGEAIVHLDENGVLESVTDDYLSSIGPVDTEPTLTPDDAIAAALAAYGADASVLTAPPKADLWVLRREADHLAYRVRLRREDGSHQTALPVFFIDASDGRVLWSYDNLQTGTGVSLYSGTVTLDTYYTGSIYLLQDINRQIGTYDLNHGTLGTGSPVLDTDDVFDAAAQRAAVDAQWGATQVYDYLLNVHGRHGLDGIQGPAIGIAADGVTRLFVNRVHYSTNYVNAFWNGDSMTYGDGDGVRASPLVSVDIVGHEMMHGVIDYTAGLVYEGQSGGLSEAYADIFGSMIERYAKGLSDNTWKLGEEAWTPAVAGDALRYLDDPHLDGVSADHFSEIGGGALDVHYSSGVANKAFYLLAMGGSHHMGGSMTGVGVDAAERIFFRGLTLYLTSSSNFAAARLATLTAAFDLYGLSPEFDAVQQTWCLVGVGPCANFVETETMLVASPNPGLVGQPITLTATVSSAGGCFAQGSVTFSEGTAVLASNVPLDGSRQAETVVSSFALGVHPLLAEYHPSNLCQASTGKLLLTVEQGTQSIAFNPPPPLKYGAPPTTVTLDVSATSGLPVGLSLISGPGRLTGYELTTTGAGTIVIRATQDGNDTYAAAQPLDLSIGVAKPTLTVTGHAATRTFWDAVPEFTGEIEGLVPPDVITAAFSTTAKNISPAGVYPIEISLSDRGGRLPNYDVVLLPAALTITNPAPVLDAIAPDTIVAGSGDTIVQLAGNDFVPGAVATVNGVVLPTKLISRTLVQTVVPAASLATAGVVQVIVSQGGPGGGTSGGVQLHVVAPDTTPPSATASASPSTLWPPNGKPVAVTISGLVVDPSGLASVTYSVEDEYGKASSSGVVSVGADGRYQFTLVLPASRLGTDTDGRVFTIRVHAVDTAGNVVTTTTQVLVPHSQA